MKVFIRMYSHRNSVVCERSAIRSVRCFFRCWRTHFWRNNIFDDYFWYPLEDFEAPELEWQKIFNIYFFKIQAWAVLFFYLNALVQFILRGGELFQFSKYSKLIFLVSLYSVLIVVVIFWLFVQICFAVFACSSDRLPISKVDFNLQISKLEYKTYHLIQFSQIGRISTN